MRILARMEPSEPTPTPRTPNMRVVSAVLFTALVLGVLGALYSMFFYAGPYRWLAELQMRWFDRYYVKSTAAFTVVLCVAPPAVALRVLQVSGLLPKPATATVTSPREPFGRRLSRAQNWLIVFAVGVGLGVFSAQSLYVAARGAKLVKISAKELEQGTQPTSTWLQISGDPVWDASLSTEENRNQFRYVPVVSALWKPGTKVAALLRFKEESGERMGDLNLRGTVDITGVPGMVQSAYEEGGLDVRDAVLLDVGESPDEKAGAARIMLPLSVVLMLVGGVVLYRRLR